MRVSIHFHPNVEHHLTFIENGITADLLCDLDKAALIDLGVDKVGPRIRLENEIQRLRLKRLRTILPLERLAEIILPDYAGEASFSEKDGLGNQVSPLSPTKQLVQKSPRNQLRRSHSSLKSSTDENRPNPWPHLSISTVPRNKLT